jgi:hypothetical protein
MDQHLVTKACEVVCKYEQHLRSNEALVASKALAKAMRELREELPPKILIQFRSTNAKT